MKRISLLLILIDNKIVLFKRSNKNKYFKNMYGLIGGASKKNETDYDCVRRECFEEIGFIPDNIKFLNKYMFYDKELYVYCVNIEKINLIELNAEHSEYKLFLENELNNNNIIESTNFFYLDYIKKFM